MSIMGRRANGGGGGDGVNLVFPDAVTLLNITTKEMEVNGFLAALSFSFNLCDSENFTVLNTSDI